MKQMNEILVGAGEETAEIINLKEGQGMQNGLSILLMHVPDPKKKKT